MHIRRFLFALTVASSAFTAAQADYTSLNTQSQEDSLEQLTRTLSTGSHIISEEERKQILADFRQKEGSLHEKEPILLNNASLGQKYISSSSAVTLSNTGYSWLRTHPLPSARVSSNYGGRTMNGRAENHSGLDLAAPTGTSIYATGPGTVTKAGWGTGYGNYVEIDHGNGYATRYAHASRMFVSVGDTVQAGEKIAAVGCTGRCTGPHLHYEVVKNGKRQNPSTYLAMLP